MEFIAYKHTSHASNIKLWNGVAWSLFSYMKWDHMTLSSTYVMVFPKKEVAIEKQCMFIYNCLLKNSHYTTWVLPITTESKSYRRIMLMWYLVPRNTIKGLCNLCKYLFLSAPNLSRPSCLRWNSHKPKWFLNGHFLQLKSTSSRNETID